MIGANTKALDSYVWSSAGIRETDDTIGFALQTHAGVNHGAIAITMRQFQRYRKGSLIFQILSPT